MHEKDVPYQDESMAKNPITIANDNLEESLVDIGTAPTCTPFPSHTRPAPVIPPPLGTTPTSTTSPHIHIGSTSSPSPNSQIVPPVNVDHSIGSHVAPNSETTSVTPENIRWGTKDVDGRIWIKPASGNNFHPGVALRGVITRIFKKKFEGSWTSWTDVDGDTKDIWFESFKALFKWLEQDEDTIRKCFNSRGSLAYKNVMFKVRKGEDKGEWIGQALLDQLRAKWEDEDWMEMDKEMTCFELYERLHRPKRKPNEWHNEKQGKIANSSTSQSISTDGESSGEVAAMKAKIDALTAKLQQKNLEQEKMNLEKEKLKQKMGQWEQKFERLMLQNNLPVLPLEPLGENVNANEDFGDDEMNDYNDLV
ncbi:hypothetical protein SESBI_22307 [Sesbania bispinosa]|nr:hypothetical protein SESBI_22307 [Sesbania bispinosa]